MNQRGNYKYLKILRLMTQSCNDLDLEHETPEGIVKLKEINR
jgi:hypothetical protein